MANRYRGGSPEPRAAAAETRLPSPPSPLAERRIMGLLLLLIIIKYELTWRRLSGSRLCVMSVVSVIFARRDDVKSLGKLQSAKGNGSVLGRV